MDLLLELRRPGLVVPQPAAREGRAVEAVARVRRRLLDRPRDSGKGRAVARVAEQQADGDLAPLVVACVEINQCVGCGRPGSVERRGTGIATPSSRRRVDGVEDDAMIQHERAVKF